MKKTILSIAAIMYLAIFGYVSSNASGLGSNYVGDGNVYVTITKNPHNGSYPWGFVNPYTGDDIELGVTDEVSERRFVGYYEDQILQFWADGKNKRYHTGHGQSMSVTDKFVINGVHFSIETNNDEIIPVTSIVEADDCSDPDISYTPVKLEYLEYFHGKSEGAPWVLRIRVSGSDIDWHLFTDGIITSEVTLNDDCDSTYNVSEEITYFNCRDGSISCSGKPGKDFEGYRLSDDIFADAGTYAGKIRVETQYGVERHYSYIVNPSDHSDLVGTNTNVKIKLYQDGKLIQAFEGNRIMTTRDKRP